jgi:hypothetical protein
MERPRESHHRRRFLCLVAALVVLASVSCGIPEAIRDVGNQAENSTTKAVSAVDDGINALTASSSDWLTVLEEVQAKLPADVQSTIRNELTSAIRLGVAAVGVETRCGIDFLRDRARQLLYRLRAHLLGDDAPAPEPAICEPVPTFVDMTLPPERRSVLQFFGYDLLRDDIRVTLETTTGAVDVTDKLAKPSAYLMTLNLGGNGVPLTPTSRRFVLAWDGQTGGPRTVAIVQPTTPVCRTDKPPAIALQPITYVPPHTGGDRDFYGHGPRIAATAQWFHDGTTVKVRIAMSAEEVGGGDATRATGTQVWDLYRAPAGYRIDHLDRASLRSERTYTDTTVDRDDDFPEGSGGPVSRWVFVGDTRGEEAGTRTRVTAHFNPLRVVLVQTGGCVPPRAVQAAQQRSQISPVTNARLAPELMQIPHDHFPMQPLRPGQP